MTGDFCLDPSNSFLRRFPLVDFRSAAAAAAAAGENVMHPSYPGFFGPGSCWDPPHGPQMYPYRQPDLLGLPCDFWNPATAGTRLQNLSSARSNSTQSKTSGTSQNSSSMSKKTRRRVATVAQRRAANIRERRRMFNLNEAFDKLRNKVPTFAYEKRLSRIETLRLAITYIGFMTELLSSEETTAARGQFSQLSDTGHGMNAAAAGNNAVCANGNQFYPGSESAAGAFPFAFAET
ncbi:unnamed protein product [Notodromas monacha]|uniref:BHLH domain-containing protein n=1 Tax=Notodromas monacha TaxID=399045 RepID=A0A7R9GHM6_9CRUS|nr:unnamed protein product [Notodromas monacha]CAG0921510.1 unnamed protein product [Notodromas monacha]